MSENFDPYRKWLGIPPAEQPPHHYRLLGVGPFESDADVIQEAADRQMAHVQTHKMGRYSALSQKLLNELAAAKVCLLNPARKSQYDAELRACLAAHKSAAAPPMAPPPHSAPSHLTPPQPAPPYAPASQYSAASAAPVATAPAARPAPISMTPRSISSVGTDPTPSSAVDFGGNYGSSRKRKKQSLGLLPLFGGLAVVVVVVLAWAVSRARKNEEIRQENKATARAAAERPAAERVKPGSTSPGAKPGDVATPADSPPVVSSGAVVDLLKLIDPTRHAVSGSWKRAGSRIVAEPNPKHSLLQIPYAPPAEYVLNLKLELAADAGVDHDALVGLVLGESRVAAILDGWGNKGSGLRQVSGKSELNVSASHGNVLREGESNAVKCTVRKQEIVVECNGKKVIHWRGNPSAFSVMSVTDVPDKRLLWLGAHGSGYALTKLELTPLSGSGQALNLRPSGVASAGAHEMSTPDRPPTESIPVTRPDEAPAPNGAMSGNPAIAAKPVAPAELFVQSGPSGEAVPDAAAQKDAAKLIREVYRKDFEQAKKPADRLSLAKKFLEQTGKSQNLVERFVLASQARDMAADNGSPGLALEAVHTLAVTFAVDEMEMAAETLETIGRETGQPTALSAAAKKELAESAMPVVERAVSQERFDVALRLLIVARGAASKTNDQQLPKQVATRTADVLDLKKQYAAAKTALETLTETPDDAAANLLIGRYVAFGRGDLEHGLPLLVKGSDPAIKELAERELNPPADTEEQIKLAENWNKAAASAHGREKNGMLARAKRWYEAVLPRLPEGLSKTKVTRALADLSGVRGATTLPAPTPGAKPTPAPGAKPAPAKNLAQRFRDVAAGKRSLVQSALVGSSIEGTPFSEAPQQGNILVGFNYTLSITGVISSWQPIYKSGAVLSPLTPWGFVNGMPATVMAKDGYAIAHFNIRYAAQVYAVQATFMKLDASGLNPQDSYTGDWVGDATAGEVVAIGNDQPIVATFARGPDAVWALGLVQLPAP